MGLTPPADGSVPVRENLARFGLFLDQAGTYGYFSRTSGTDRSRSQGIADRTLTPETRENLTDSTMSIRGLPRADADREVQRLESAARNLPEQVVAYGTASVSTVSHPNKPGNS